MTSKISAAHQAARELTTHRVDVVAAMYLAWIDAQENPTAAVSALQAVQESSKRPEVVLVNAAAIYAQVAGEEPLGGGSAGVIFPDEHSDETTPAQFALVRSRAFGDPAAALAAHFHPVGGFAQEDNGDGTFTITRGGLWRIQKTFYLEEASGSIPGAVGKAYVEMLITTPDGEVIDQSNKALGFNEWDISGAPRAYVTQDPVFNVVTIPAGSIVSPGGEEPVPLGSGDLWQYLVFGWLMVEG